MSFNLVLVISTDTLSEIYHYIYEMIKKYKLNYIGFIYAEDLRQLYFLIIYYSTRMYVVF